ncbi:MAG TPA: hypothetical protein VMR59_01340 [Patescibacteria group bacterium]|jgi:hypothetical protein|nr:hypothetical protein [Patescibacteria group bacterium]
MAISRIEQAGYPYIKGLHGIPFNQLPLESEGVVVSGSGRQLYCELDQSRISVIDINEQMLGLLARVTHGMMTLNLQTRLDANSSTEVHPDLFGAKFVEMALVNFRNNGVNVVYLIGKWHPGSVNYDAFQKVKLATGDMVLAARSTWTGKIAALHGFTELKVEDMLEDEEMGNRYVRAIFRRPR